MKHEFEVFVILVDGNFQTVRGEHDNAFEVRDNFNDSFKKNGRDSVAQVVLGSVSYDPKVVLSENA